MTRYRLANAREKARAAYAVIQAPEGSTVTITPPEENNGGETGEDQAATDHQ